VQPDSGRRAAGGPGAPGFPGASRTKTISSRRKSRPPRSPRLREETSPTCRLHPEVVEAMLKLGGVKSGDILYDLGCGDGRIVGHGGSEIRRPDRNRGGPQTPCASRRPWRTPARPGCPTKTRFIEKNLFDADIHDATVVTLLPAAGGQFAIASQAAQRSQGGNAHCFPSVRHGRLAAREEDPARLAHIYLWTVTEKAKKDYGGAAAGK